MKTPDKDYNFKKIEEEVSNFWKNSKIKQKVLSTKRKKTFSFLEGPPTANALPGLHHTEARVFKDLFCRFKYMQGYYVPRKGGWDCHGLPVEVQVEKKLELNSKKEVLDYGIEKFNSICRTDVFSFIEKWNDFTEKLAYWVDLELPYITMNNDYIESVWWSLKELYKKNLLFQDYKVVPYCPRCGTSLSSHEVALGYEDVTEETIVVRFKIKNSHNKENSDDKTDNKKPRYFLAWTTTPWTLPSNLSLALNPEIVYAIVEHENSEYILAKELVKKYFDDSKIIKEVKGRELVGIEYEPLFDFFKEKLDKKAFVVIPADFVSIEEGTGIVHQAPAFGEEDYEACKQHGIAFVNPVGEDGKFTSEIKELEGLFVKDADRKIVQMLKDSHALFKVEEYTHSYPFCWRCKTPLLYYARQSWFIRVSDFRQKLLEKNKEINWFPEHIKEGRFGNWLEGAKDWALSRSKFWGTPLPIWRCENCGAEKVIGSVKELRKEGIKVPKQIDLHKPFIDEIKLKCKCGRQMQRVPDVIDCWYDSGSASFAQYHYPFENKSLFKKYFPYDFIAEALDQTRGWFYTLHVLGVLLFDSIAYKNVVCAGLIVDEHGEKMSKSKGNIIDPWEAFNELSIDAIRLQMCYTAPGNTKRFSYNLVKETPLSFLKLFWNSYFFVSEYFERTNIDTKDFTRFFEKPDARKLKELELKIEDRWLVSRANSLVAEVTEALEKHEYDVCVKSIMKFVDEDFSRWYIKLVRSRTSSKDPALAFTFLYAFDKVIRLMAPFSPYVTEKIYQDFLHTVLNPEHSEESVHMAEWPKPKKSLVDEKLEENMEAVKQIVSVILSLREKKTLGVRWPLSKAIVVSKDKEILKAAKKLSKIILKQANIKQLETVEKSKKIKTAVRAEYSKLGPEFGNLTPKIIAQFAVSSSEAILTHIEKEGFFTVVVDGKECKIKAEHIIIEKAAEQPFLLAELKDFSVMINPILSEELAAEGYVRELIRRIQALRKKSGMQKSDSISLFIRTEKKALEMLSKIPDFEEKIKKSTGSSNMEFSENEPTGSFEHSSDEDIKRTKFAIYISRI